MKADISKDDATPTLDDVARKAGVSTATVSRCLNNPDRVVEATRARVMEAVKALEYTPNFAARVMAAKRTFTIGAIIPTMDNAIFARGLQAFQEALHARGYTLLVSSSAYRPDVEEEQIRALVARGADGLLLIGHDRDAPIYEYLERQKVPALAAWSFMEDGQIPSIGFDNRAAMSALAKEVIRLGHRRIAMISGISQGNDRARERIEGLKDALRESALDVDDLEIIETTYEVENGAEAFTQLMSRDVPPTAVLCGNDVLAVGASLGAKRLGLRVPQDVSITGFDDIELARITSPALTTVHVPHREMGRKAADALIDMVEGKKKVVSAKLETSIKKRHSLGPCPGTNDDPDHP
ncbi:substrate-binding domain-containing protein [Sulfitobacter sp. JBTF-M27]|uniref:Substrate-binding domain-containing protein n=1 Tax=Sulfitobacter sediminilitoris TaxID=2698830 RepID=A0A6P0C6W0_9RHOB|nr:LacI family DNA-binding transcriptional regulator [Sulfitobacter sediminilitoris]NEK21911.1 substrate-binding domain-containing protein [Sulfitobacter sediminilitoris]